LVGLFSARSPQRDGGARSHNTGMGRGTELAITPLVFVGVGWLVDRWLGTAPVATLVIATLGIAGTFLKVWIGYDRDMRAAEAGKPWARRAEQPVEPESEGPLLGGAS
jgi:F0F1-type ATP synthase assembly protein I